MFQNKIIHNVLATNVSLFRAKIRDYDIRPQCLADRYTIDHMFLHCSLTSPFWSLFQKWRVSKTQGPFIWSRVPETTLLQRQVYRAFINENVVSVGRVKVNPAWLFITLIEKLNVQIFLFLWVSFGHPITICFAELIFTSLIRISALNPKSRYYLAKARAVPGRRVKAFIWRKVVPLARVTLPAEVRQLAQPSCLAPRDEFAFLM